MLVMVTKFFMYPTTSPCLTLTVFLTSVTWTSTLTGCPRQINFTSESSALESLECRNDYRTHIRCSWKENPHIPLSLFHMDPDNKRVDPCVLTPDPSQNSTGHERVFCLYNTSLFAIGFDDVFFFHTPHSPAISRTFKLSKHNDTKWIFNRLDVISSPMYSSVAYVKSLLTADPIRHHDQQQTKVDINREAEEKREMKIHTGSTLKDKEDVNMIETEGSGMLFDRPTQMSDHELPGPSNFCCAYSDEKILSCSWDLTTDLTQYITYTLSYKTHSSALTEWRCVEKVEVMNTGSLLRMVGLIDIFEPGVLQVQLTPTPVTRVIRAYEHIQPSRPTGLSVDLREEDWILNWTLPKYRTIPLSSELQYWRILTPEDVKIIYLSDPVMVFSIPERSLMGSSEYRARVRCSVSTRRRSGQRYAGYPSDWTDPVTWTTQSESFAPRLVACLLYFLIAALSVAFSMLVFFILVVMQRRLRDWSASLPSPVHSKVSEHPQSDLLVSCRELKDPDITSVHIVDVQPQFSSIDSESATLADGSNHWSQTTVVHVGESSRLCTFGNVMGINLTQFDNALLTHAFSLSDAVLQCSEGYTQNPDTTQNALHLNAEMNDRYMNCLKPGLSSTQGKKTPVHPIQI
ncbi:cytokine receptor common subunit beta-like isoform X2 [Paramisgurnus dabryanus]|uniref:cytokine receptor common subunit beta-like isoform X2 n=1 Tax=Paramisgurnus dabryanus TaxID=90735 RepID=UPI0031F37A78